jgi:uncharacterized protein YjbI with pentapeptide repeats
MADNVEKYDNPKRQFDESQYEILIRCSVKGDLTEWNEWREKNQKASILLEGANFISANLEGADLWKANLEGANLRNVNLAGADLWKANLKGAKLIAAIVDRQTFIWGCDFDKQTIFIGKGLYSARIEPRMKESLRINLN